MCKSVFTTKENLNEHHKTKHVQRKCKWDVCNFVFNSNESLSLHIEKKHASTEEPLCIFCGLITKSSQKITSHIRHCETEFTQVKNKTCRYFIKGTCFKGNDCIFTHPEKEKLIFVPPCRNGSQCRYLVRGVCKFYHRGFEAQIVQNQRHKNKTSSTYRGFQGRPNKW